MLDAIEGQFDATSQAAYVASLKHGTLAEVLSTTILPVNYLASDTAMRVRLRSIERTINLQSRSTHSINSPLLISLLFTVTIHSRRIEHPHLAFPGCGSVSMDDTGRCFELNHLCATGTCGLDFFLGLVMARGWGADCLGLHGVSCPSLGLCSHIKDRLLHLYHDIRTMSMAISAQ
ncbi:hypothetical protein PAXRUDRAFT_261198 [Paxillus rubicundulus Ve08.2h10]|uniref:Uncharacterized protein n=1 Tax=Paxillus rubicundulus Ve08.2h10 TaxID=930991 RepID=A0A0D0E0N0_9AGAM|nr:hypothetical protein PAXRUDRAFT_261198 [Paxillus rubicundulus Ve08.2h10]